MKWISHLQTMRSASKMGNFFPSFQKTTSAPLGSDEIAHSGSYLKRLQQEVLWFRCSEHHVPFPNIKKGIRILHLSDLHIRDQNTWLTRLCSFLSTLEADIVVYTGDVVTKGWTQEAVNQLFSSAPKGKLGTFAVMGNWEHWSQAQPHLWRPILEPHGIQLLVEEQVSFDDFGIFGTDDHLAGSSDPDKWTFDHKPYIALSHSPAFFPKLCIDPIRLVLSGHAHGGQIRLPFLKALWVPKGTDQYVAGWFQNNKQHLFVSRGLGWSVAPLRFFCPPEAAYIHLVPSSEPYFSQPLSNQ